MTDGVSVLGVRHHGPGSARSVVRALERLEPDLVLIEGPPDAQSVLEFAADPDMRPPVALVVYPPERPGRGVFYPFATFSPEWNALRWALARDVPVRLCDLPQANSLANGEARDDVDQSDPVRMLAQAAGEEDVERWWERLVEQRADDTDVFRAVLQAMAAVREGLPAPPRHEAQREASMRQAIRDGRRAGHRHIAVVCGAWHAPALDALPSRASDEALLRGLKRVRVEATWVPWTASRLAYASGYGAGVESPAWYRHLWDTNGDLTTWLAAAARLLRDEDLDASPAQVVDAVRLAETLAALRGRPQPSLAEAAEATLSVLCNGESGPFTLIYQKLVVGEDMGDLPRGVPAVPLQRDIDALARRLRVRPAAEERTIDLDLRQAHHLEQSQFLHRLRLLGIDWGRLQPVQRGRLGTFHELWTLRWRPEFVLAVVEAGVFGNTLADAATASAIARAERGADLGEVAALVELALLANLQTAIPKLVTLLGARSAESNDVAQLLRVLPPLASTLRYGDVRQTDTGALASIVRAVVERMTVGLPPACSGLDDSAAESMAKDIAAASQSLGVLTDEAGVAVVTDWWAALRRLIDVPETAALIAGSSTRLLLNAERLEDDEAAVRFERALSRGSQPAEAARWVEGFLQSSGLVLATSARLFGLLDRWLAGLRAEYFEQVLPLLRRTTSTFSTGERRQIGERVRSGAAAHLLLLGGVDDVDVERAALVEPIVLRILGLRTDD